MMFTDKLLNLMHRDAKVCVLTGAGISAESGVPTFRGDNGLWENFKPEELATVDAFLTNPKLVLEWYQYRRDLIDKIEPNPGHYTLSRMQKYFKDFTLVTQNVDGLHQRAGSTNILELHGNILNNKCSRCGRSIERVDFMGSEEMPLCDCGGKIRPDVVWFGEMLPQGVLEEATIKSTNADLFFSIGTSAIVYPAAALPITASQNNAYLVEINIERTELSNRADEVLLGPSGEILPKLFEAAGIDQ